MSSSFRRRRLAWWDSSSLSESSGSSSSEDSSRKTWDHYSLKNWVSKIDGNRLFVLLVGVDKNGK